MFKQTIRVFLSSTFKDLKAERDALHKDAFYRLRQFCESEGFQFHAIDLRWGVSQEAAWDQRTESLCLNEIRRCQRITPRPNFVALMGQRYGWRPLPTSLSVADWDMLRSNCEADLRLLLEKWYRLDENQIPPNFRLRPRINESERCDSVWLKKVEIPLRDLFLRTSLKYPNEVSTSLRNTDLSLTEKEILLGAEHAVKNDWQAFAYFRTFAGIQRKELQEPWVDRDDSKKMVDKAAGQKLENLKQRLIKNPLVTTVEYEATLCKNANNVESPNHESIKNLNQQVFEHLQKSIQLQIAAFKSIGKLDREVREHADFGKEKLRNYVVRQPEETVARNYVGGANQRPLVFYGKSGSGKSSLLARIDTIVRDEFPGVHCVSRFIGATGNSSSLRSLIDSIEEQIAKLTGVERPNESSKSDLVAGFRWALSNGTSSKKLVVILDAIDQLSPDDHALSTSWIPRILPKNCSLILSCMSDDDARYSGYGVFPKLAERLGDNAMLEVSDPNQGELRMMLEDWLKSYDRKLSARQTQIAAESLAHCPRPLYLRVLVELAKYWHSDHQVGSLPTSIHDIIHLFLDRLVTRHGHGESLLQSTLGLLAASRAGLTEVEMFDLLSRDDRVLDEFAADSRYDYPDKTRGLPPIILSRLFFDLDFFLGTTTAAGVSVVNFYHRQLAFVANRRYLVPNDINLRKMLVDYFRKQAIWHSKFRRSPNFRRTFELAFQLRMIGDRPSIQEYQSLLLNSERIDAKLDIEKLSGVDFDLSWDLLNDIFEFQTMANVNDSLNKIVDFFVTQWSNPNSSLAKKFRPGDLHSYFYYRSPPEFYLKLLQSLTTLAGEGLTPRMNTLCARAKVDLGGHFRRKRDFSNASQLLENANGSGSLSDADRGTLHYEIGYIHYLKNQYSDARYAFAKSITNAKSAGDLVGAEISKSLELWSYYLANPDPKIATTIVEETKESLELFTSLQNSDPRAFRWVMNSLAHLVNAAYLSKDAEIANLFLQDLIANPWVQEFEEESWCCCYRARCAMLSGQFQAAAMDWEEYFASRNIDQFTESGAWPVLDFGVTLAKTGDVFGAKLQFERGLEFDTNGTANAPWQERIKTELDRLQL